MKLKILLVVIASIVLSGCSFFDKKQSSGIQVITNDIPSSVFINGQYLEKAPLIEKSIQPGVYSIRIQPDDPQFVPYETNVTLRKGLLSVITWKPGDRPETSGGVIYEMEPIESESSEISFSSIPDGAIVSLDAGEKIFVPHVFESIDPGHHEFEVTLPSYETQRHTINALAGYRMVVSIKLAKVSGAAGDDITPTAGITTAPTITPGSATASASPAATSSAISNNNTVLIQPTNFFQQGVEVLRVRANPDPASAEVGFVEVGKKYPYTDKQANWFKISFADKQGWVSAQYAIVQ